jgi:hypothetical protein
MPDIDQMIYNTAIANGFNPQGAKIIAAQARFESADYTSSVFKANNNTSGIKYIGSKQKNAQQGTLSPEGDYYAKFDTIQDAINDKIVRLYNLTMGGVTPKQLKDTTDPTEFATLLKKRGYYGNTAYGTPQATSDIENYAGGLKSKLLKINVIAFVKKNKYTLGLGILIASLATFFYLKLKKQ